MDRRAFLSLATLLPACAAVQAKPREGDALSQRSGIPPWHMWGNTQVIENAAGTAGEEPTNGQILRISYLRPETWHFVLAAKLFEAPLALPAATVAHVALIWNLTIGIGRSVSRLEFFELFDWSWTAPQPPPRVQIRVTEALQVNTRSIGNPTPVDVRATTSNLIQEVTAQDIQLDVLCQYFTNPLAAGAGTSVKLQVDAMFAPKTHVRPEWFKGGTFPGAEDGGGSSNVAAQMDRLNKGAAPVDPADAAHHGEMPWHPDAAEQEAYNAHLREIYRREWEAEHDADHYRRQEPHRAPAAPIIHRPQPALQRRVLQVPANTRKRSG